MHMLSSMRQKEVVELPSLIGSNRSSRPLIWHVAERKARTGAESRKMISSQFAVYEVNLIHFCVTLQKISPSLSLFSKKESQPTFSSKAVFFFFFFNSERDTLDRCRASKSSIVAIPVSGYDDCK